MTMYQRSLQIANAIFREGPYKSKRLLEYNNMVWLVTNTQNHQIVIKFGRGDPQNLQAESHWLQHEYEVTRWAYEHDLCHRRMLGIGSDNDESSLISWLAMEYVAGSNARKFCLSAHDAIKVAKKIMGNLFRLHEQPASDFPIAPKIINPPYSPETILYQLGSGKTIRHIVDVLGRSDFQVPCHGDVSFNNVIVVNSSCNTVELIDWSLCRLQNPAIDIAPLFVWLSLWQDLRSTLELWGRVSELYQESHVTFFRFFHVFLARSSLMRSQWEGAEWGVIAEELLNISSPYKALHHLFSRVNALNLYHQDSC